MVFLSCFQNFCVRTLAHIPNAFSKLDFICSLRSNGRYKHWGLARTYGARETDDALASAHTELWIQTLRTRSSELYSEFIEYSVISGVTAEEWQARCTGLVPANKGGGGDKHFAAVACALVELSRSRHKDSKVA